MTDQIEHSVDAANDASDVDFAQGPLKAWTRPEFNKISASEFTQAGFLSGSSENAVYLPS